MDRPFVPVYYIKTFIKFVMTILDMLFCWLTVHIIRNPKDKAISRNTTNLTQPQDPTPTPSSPYTLSHYGVSVAEMYL